MIKGNSLKVLLEKSEFRLNPNTPLMMLWMREIFVAFKDLLHKTVYMPILPIKRKNIFVSEEGLK